MVLKIESIKEFQTVAFRCTKRPLHTDGCAFVGKELEVSRLRP